MLAEPEVRQVHVIQVTAAGLPQQNVGGLDVAVHQSVGVRGVQRRGDLARDYRGPFRAQAAFRLDQRSDVTMSDVSHGNEQDPSRLASLEHRDDVRVVDARRGARLAHEPLSERLVLAEVRGEDLQGDQAAEAEVEGTVDDGHAATADPFLDLVPGELLPWSEIAGSRMDVLCHC